MIVTTTTATLALSPAPFTAPAATAADFVAAGMVGSVTLVRVTRPEMKVRNLAEPVAAMRAGPGRYNFASPGNGGMHHVLFERIKAQEKLSATHMPYQGSMTAVSDLMTGRVDCMFLDAVAAMPQIQAGKVNVIAVAAARRRAALPGLATVAETFPAVDAQAWQCIAAPRATPAAIAERLNSEWNKQLEMPERRAQLLRMGVDAKPMPVAALNALIAKDEQRLGALLRAIGIRAN
jgi:tripartite-type tricarboxylate transporter receptor subunit TctC